MFASFTSILSPALKEKLGIGPKPAPPREIIAPPAPPLTVPAGRGVAPLPVALQTEVQSPGFSSRLSALVRGEEGRGGSPSPSRLGQLPIVSLTKRALPRFSRRREEGRAPVMLRIAPQEPYSPFKRYGGVGERGAGRSGKEGGGGPSSTDPRQVIAALAELSGEFHFAACHRQIKSLR